jgi:hypothetical protein
MVRAICLESFHQISATIGVAVGFVLRYRFILELGLCRLIAALNRPTQGTLAQPLAS